MVSVLSSNPLGTWSLTPSFNSSHDDVFLTEKEEKRRRAAIEKGVAKMTRVLAIPTGYTTVSNWVGIAAFWLHFCFSAGYSSKGYQVLLEVNLVIKLTGMNKKYYS